MLEKNNINEEAIAKLSEGLNKLTTVATQLSEVTEATLATKDFASNLKQASETAKKLTDVMSNDLEAAAEYSESLKKVASNASQMLETFSSTTTSTAELAQQIKELNDKISSLNKVYGNMLSAMRVNG
jgi:methyl-accepting chemotaxis protein